MHSVNTLKILLQKILFFFKQNLLVFHMKLKDIISIHHMISHNLRSKPFLSNKMLNPE